jgi:hypothetical protein
MAIFFPLIAGTKGEVYYYNKGFYSRAVERKGEVKHTK